MSTVAKNPVIKIRSGEVRSSLTKGVVDEFELKAMVDEILNRWPTVVSKATGYQEPSLVGHRCACRGRHCTGCSAALEEWVGINTPIDSR